MLHAGRTFLLAGAAVFAAALVACGGGGGGGGGTFTPSATPTPTPTATAAPSVSGDMLALSASRGWNYQGTNSTGSYTISTYADPQPVASASPLLATAVSGLVPTVLTSPSSVQNNLIGVLGLNQSAAGYTVAYEFSAGSVALLPGPQLVPSTLTLGQSFTPYPGTTANVIAVGTQPGGSACPTPAAGATVAYVVSGQTYTVSYVPGCGITNFVYPGGATYTLVSVGTYASLGELSSQRVPRGIGFVSTVRSLLGLEHHELPAAHLKL
jgi:hypothetical protein